MDDGTDPTLVEDYSNVYGTDTSFGQGVIAASQDSTPVYSADTPGVTPPTPPAGIPVGPSAPGSGFTLPGGIRLAFPTYSPLAGVTVNPNALLRQAGIVPAATANAPFGFSLNTSTAETFLIAALIGLGIYAVVKL